MQYLFARAWEGFTDAFPTRRFDRLEGPALERGIAGYARAYLSEHRNTPMPAGVAADAIEPGAEGDALARYLCPHVGVRVSKPVYLAAMPSSLDSHRITSELSRFASSRGWGGLGLRFGVVDHKKLTDRAEAAIKAVLSGAARRPLVTSAFAAAVEPLEAHAHALIWGVEMPAPPHPAWLAA